MVTTSFPVPEEHQKTRKLENSMTLLEVNRVLGCNVFEQARVFGLRELECLERHFRSGPSLSFGRLFYECRGRPILDVLGAYQVDPKPSLWAHARRMVGDTFAAIGMRVPEWLLPYLEQTYFWRLAQNTVVGPIRAGDALKLWYPDHAPGRLQSAVADEPIRVPIALSRVYPKTTIMAVRLA